MGGNWSARSIGYVWQCSSSKGEVCGRKLRVLPVQAPWVGAGLPGVEPGSSWWSRAPSTKSTVCLCPSLLHMWCQSSGCRNRRRLAQPWRLQRQPVARILAQPLEPGKQSVPIGLPIHASRNCGGLGNSARHQTLNASPSDVSRGGGAAEPMLSAMNREEPT